MKSTGRERLRIGAWCVDPVAGRIFRGAEEAHVETRAMRLLVHLAWRAGEVVSVDEILDHVWPDVTVTPDSVYQAVASLRRQLGDDPSRPSYITTAPRLGYRMVAPVSPWIDEPAGEKRGPKAWRGRPVALAAGAGLCLALGVGVWAFGEVGRDERAVAPAVQAKTSIAVMPFLDLTADMDQEPFADGIAEEVIDQLNRSPGLRVSAPRSSFYFKGKRASVAEISKALGVAYVLDGSVRRSSARLRVAVRLVRADTGFVAWSESYDRPFADLLWVQEDIAGEVAKALATTGAIPERTPVSAPAAP